MIYKDVELEKRYLNDDHPLATEFKEIIDIDSFYRPDESISFYDNLSLKYKFDLRKQCLKSIYDIKLKFFSETGEKL